MIIRLILLVAVAALMTGCPKPSKVLLPVDSPLSKWEPPTENVEMMTEPAPAEPEAAKTPAAGVKIKPEEAKKAQ